MTAIISQIQEFLRGLAPSARRAILIGAAVALVTVVGVGIWASRPTYVVLTRAGSADEASLVIRALGASGVPYRLDPDGVTITVPQSAQIDARKVAAAEGIYVGLEDLPTIPAFVTPGQEQLYAKRMIQGELVRMVNALQGIASSDVQISLPERSAFLRNQQRATASVSVHPEAGSAIDPGAAQSIAQLVSHAVNGMTPQDVTVVDASTMRILWGAGGELDPASQLGQQLATRTLALESSLASVVRGALGQVLGDPNSSSVVVRVELESEELQTTTRVVDPDKVVTSVEQLETERSAQEASTAAAGIPGTESNLPERSGGGAGAGSGRERESQSTTYDFGSTVSTVSKPPGDIRRISASILVDAAAFSKVAEGADADATKKLLETAVRGALGASDKRGDVVVFDVVPFSPVQPSAELAGDSTVVESVSALLPGLTALLGVLLTFFFVVRPLVQVAGQAAVTGPGRPAQLEGGPGAPQLGEGASNLSFAERIRAQVGALESHTSTGVSELVEKESEHSAEVLRRWIRG